MYCCFNAHNLFDLKFKDRAEYFCGLAWTANAKMTSINRSRKDYAHYAQ